MRWLTPLFVCLLLSQPLAADEIYKADFEGEVGKEWSHTKTEATKAGKRKILGRFKNDVVILKLAKIGDHAFVRVQFDVVVIGGWRGNDIMSADSKVIGPDQWGLMAGSRTLVHTTFANDATDKTTTQAYPGPMGQFKLAPQSASTEKGTLGYKADAVYRIDVCFAHSDATLALRFYAQQLAADDSESWGIDNLVVTGSKEAPDKLTADQVPEAWKALQGKDAAASERAAWRMARAGDATLSVIRSALIGDASKEEKAIAALIEQLDSAKYKVREDATKKLVAMGTSVIEPLRKALEKPVSLEVKSRLERVIRKLSKAAHEDSDRLRRLIRAVRVLDLMRGEKPRKLITELQGALTGRAALSLQSHFVGKCSQDGMALTAIEITITERKGDELHGIIHWPTINDCKTKIKGKIVDGVFVFKEYEIIQGSGVLVPVDYKLRIVGHRIVGPWIAGNQIGGLDLRMTRAGTPEKQPEKKPEKK